jgi:hypothetical protein
VLDNIGDTMIEKKKTTRKVDATGGIHFHDVADLFLELPVA